MSIYLLLFPSLKYSFIVVVVGHEKQYGEDISLRSIESFLLALNVIADMSNIRTLLKYFFMGLIFHACIFIIFGVGFSFYYGSLINSLIVAFEVAIVLAVGLIKGGRLGGVAFGASYFLPSIISIFLIDYYPHYYYFGEYWAQSALHTFILVVYGYVPASFYRQKKTRKALTTGFLFAFFVDLIAFFPYYLLGLFSIFNLIFGGLSTLLCFRHLKPTLTPSPRVTPTRKPYSPPQPGKPARGGVRCPICGHSNPAAFNYCGKCGSSLKEREETQIY